MSSRRTRVDLPVPEGALMTRMTPCLLAILFPLLDEALADSFGLDGRKDDVIRVRDHDGPGLPALGGVDEPVLLPGVLPQAAHGRRSRVDDGDDPRVDDEI